MEMKMRISLILIVFITILLGCNKEDFMWDLPRENPYDGQITDSSGYQVPTVGQITDTSGYEVPNKDAPKVTTGSATNISDSTSSVSGDINFVGSSEISSYGHCWSVNPMPTMADAITNLGTKNSTGIFSSYLSNLSQNTTYYVRAYATNSFGTSYGNQINFNTTKYEYCADFTSNITGWTSVGWWISSNPNDNKITNDWQGTGTSTLSKTFSMLPGDMSLTFSYGTYYGGDLFSNQSISVKVNSVIYFSGLSSGTEIISLPKGDCLIEFIAIDNNVSESISLSDICIN
jgi:hypothetical protein